MHVRLCEVGQRRMPELQRLRKGATQRHSYQCVRKVHGSAHPLGSILLQTADSPPAPTAPDTSPSSATVNDPVRPLLLARRARTPYRTHSLRRLHQARHVHVACAPAAAAAAQAGRRRHWRRCTGVSLRRARPRRQMKPQPATAVGAVALGLRLGLKPGLGLRPGGVTHLSAESCPPPDERVSGFFGCVLPRPCWGRPSPLVRAPAEAAGARLRPAAPRGAGRTRHRSLAHKFC